MIRFLLTLVILAALVYLAATVQLGKRTFFGHIQAIWKTEEMKELKEGVGEKAGPAVEKVKRGVKAGLDEADKEDGSAARDGGVDAMLEKPAH